MIAHRATVFEENSAVFFERQRKQGVEPAVVAGHRARWSDRGKLALAKHAAELSPTSTETDFASILLRPSPDPGHPEDDVFIEVHIYGPLTRRTLSRVTVDTARAGKAMADDLRARTRKGRRGRSGVDVQERVMDAAVVSGSAGVAIVSDGAAVWSLRRLGATAAPSAAARRRHDIPGLARGTRRISFSSRTWTRRRSCLSSTSLA